MKSINIERTWREEGSGGWGCPKWKDWMPKTTTELIETHKQSRPSTEVGERKSSLGNRESGRRIMKERREKVV